MNNWFRLGVLALCFFALAVNASAGRMGWVVVMAVCIGANAFFLGSFIDEKWKGGAK